MHGFQFTPMQIRIWSEMLVGGIHCSLDNPPVSAMFVRAGKGTNSKKKEGSSSNMTDALTSAAVAISSALSPCTTPTAGHKTGSGSSPARIIESRSKCYKQLHDLNSLVF